MNNAELFRLTQDLDIGFTSGRNNPWTILNRGSGAGFRHAFDRSYPTHTLLRTSEEHQVMATELTEDGIEEDSMMKYIRDGKNGKLLDIYRFKGWTAETVLAAKKHLAELRQIDAPYSFWEAIGKNKVIRKLFPRLTSRHNKTRMTCDENVFTVHRDFGGWTGYPMVWDIDSRLFHPTTLRNVIRADKQFKLVYSSCA